MYLEAMLDVLPKVGNKYIIDSEQKNLLPFLNMGDQPMNLPQERYLQKGE
jgi:membrane protease subunit HflK